MSDRVAFETAVEVLSAAPERGTSFCEPFLMALPIDRAAISTLGSPFARESLFATDATAARFAEIQLDLGEGPCWLAASTRGPVLVGDIRALGTAVGAERWPTLSHAIRSLDVAGVYAFPLMVGTLTVGAVDLHTRVPGELNDDQIVDAQNLANIAARRALGAHTHGSDIDDDPGFSRRGAHQATGMVLAQLNSSAADASLMIQGHAFSSGRSVRDVPADIVARRLDFFTLDES